MKPRIQHTLLALALLATFTTFYVAQPSTAFAAPLGTAFTYQGRLNAGGSPATGIYDLRFAIYDAGASGNLVGGPVTNSATGVTNGLFTVTLDFGTVFDGSARWLEIYVHNSTNDPEVGWVYLSPRQPLTPAPYALYAPTAGVAATSSNVVVGSVSASGLGTPVVPGPGQMLVFNGGSLVWTNPGAAVPAWMLGGNGGTTPGVNFLGTTDNQPLEFKVNGVRALRLQPNTTNAPNVIGGSPANQVAAGSVGSAIGGGGKPAQPNVINSDYSAIGGGYANIIQANAYQSTIGGGYNNAIQSTLENSGNDSTIGGGEGNQITGGGTIGGGYHNTIESQATYSIIGGGYHNTIWYNATCCTIGGGQENNIQTNAYSAIIAGGAGNGIGSNAWYATVGGGGDNTIQPDAHCSIIGGGLFNSIQTNASYSFIGGGSNNSIQINATCAVLGGGAGNDGKAAYSFLGGGYGNAIQPNADSAVLVGGLDNVIQPNALNSALVGGNHNSIQTNASYSFLGGGYGNEIQPDATYALLVGGYHNSIQTNAGVAVLVGGLGNVIQSGAFYSLLVGGLGNSIQTNASESVLGGGECNYIEPYADHSVIGGGYYNTVAAPYSVVPGGDFNYVVGQNSFAAGHRAMANYIGDFVWADSQDEDFNSTSDDQFAVRAGGGVVLQTPSITVPGAGLGTATPVFIHQCTAGNRSGVLNNQTIINNPNCNGNPNAILLVTFNQNAGGVENPYATGVYYNGSNWTIYNLDGSTMTIGATFNVLVFKP